MFVGLSSELVSRRRSEGRNSCSWVSIVALKCVGLCTPIQTGGSALVSACIPAGHESVVRAFAPTRHSRHSRHFDSGCFNTYFSVHMKIIALFGQTRCCCTNNLLSSAPCSCSGCAPSVRVGFSGSPSRLLQFCLHPFAALFRQSRKLVACLVPVFYSWFQLWRLPARKSSLVMVMQQKNTRSVPASARHHLCRLKRPTFSKT